MDMMKRIESIFINRVDLNHGGYRYHLGKRKIGSLDEYKKTKNIYYLMAPSFGNVGDEAIVESSILYLKDMFFEFTLVVIDYVDTLQTLQEIKRICKKEDIIVLQGGGNIGTLYYDAERMREFILEKFPNTTIISMPQSIFFSNDQQGKRRLDRCKKTYNSHSNFIIIAREQYSYEIMMHEFSNCKVLLNPDIVFYLSKIINSDEINERSGIMTCLRTDKEDILKNKRFSIIHNLAEKYDDLIISDTCVSRNIPNEIRTNEVFSLINQFKKMRIIITDRLHGMVLAALTNTPCIVMPSIDKKVIGTYNWIQDIDFVKFINKNDIDDITKIVEEMLIQKYEHYDWDSFRIKHFSDLRKRIGV